MLNNPEKLKEEIQEAYEALQMEWEEEGKEEEKKEDPLSKADPWGQWSQKASWEPSWESSWSPWKKEGHRNPHDDFRITDPRNFAVEVLCTEERKVRYFNWMRDIKRFVKGRPQGIGVIKALEWAEGSGAKNISRDALSKYEDWRVED